jgi:hypothetical protein
MCEKIPHLVSQRCNASACNANKPASPTTTHSTTDSLLAILSSLLCAVLCEPKTPSHLRSRDCASFLVLKRANGGNECAVCRCNTAFGAA